MIIETKEFAITRSQLFLIFLQNIFRRRWFVFIGIVLFGLLAWEAGISAVIVLILMLWGLYLVFLVAVSFLKTEPKGNQLYYQERSCKIDHESITCLYRDGSFNKYKFSLIRRVLKSRDYYLFYLSRHHFIYLANSAIANANDLKVFETLLKVKFT